MNPLSRRLIRILHLEDIQDESIIVEDKVRKSGLICEWKWVDSKEGYNDALKTFRPDIVISDHSMPGFSSAEAFRILREFGFEIPFILVTATVSEDFAVTMMRNGVADYVLKDRLTRLPSAIENALEKWEAERENKAYISQIIRSEARFRALTENNFDAIVLGEAPHDVTYATPSLGRMLGYSQDELHANNVINFHPDDRPAIEQVYTDARMQPGIPLPAVARVQHRNGNYIWAEGVITNMLDNESVRGIVANYRDVTERKEAEIHEARMTRDLVQRNKDLEQFAYIVSHNLRGPVANILGISHIIRESKASEKDRMEAMEGIFIATSRLDEVILDLNHILDTKQESNNKKEVVVFHDIVDSVKVGIEGIISKNNVKIVTDFSQVNSILTIRSFLQSIFYNLISNSIKYKQQATDLEIRITSVPNVNGVRLVFSDNGMGIDMETQGSKVFGLYKRFHTRHAEGKGMGLFMVKTQVESLGGEISIKSEVNKGTEFMIDL